MRKSNFFNKNFNKLFQNVFVLYLLVALAIINVIGYVYNRNLSSLVLFIVIGIGTSFITKNMIWILFCTILLTNIISQTGILRGQSNIEGLESSKNPKKNTKKMMEEKMEINMSKPPMASSSSKTNKGKSKMNPSIFSELSDSESEDEAVISKPKINQKKTLENSFSNLDKMIGSKGVQNMTKDTSDLLEKQEHLIGQLKSMEPMMTKANDMLQTLQGGNILGGLFSGKKKEE